MSVSNDCRYIGRLTRDPEIRTTNSGLKVASFSIAVDRDFKDKETGEKITDFFRCEAWRGQADFVEAYVTKGNLVALKGSTFTEKYTDKDGNERESLKVSVDGIKNLTPRSENQQGDYQQDNYQPQQQAPRQQAAPRQPQRPAQSPQNSRPAAPSARKPVAAAVNDVDDSDPFADE